MLEFLTGQAPAGVGEEEEEAGEEAQEQSEEEGEEAQDAEGEAEDEEKQEGERKVGAQAGQAATGQDQRQARRGAARERQAQERRLRRAGLQLCGAALDDPLIANEAAQAGSLQARPARQCVRACLPSDDAAKAFRRQRQRQRLRLARGETRILRELKGMKQALKGMKQDMKQDMEQAQQDMKQDVSASFAKVMGAIGFVTEAATWRQYEEHGVSGGEMKLTSLNDVLDLVLPEVVRRAALRHPNLIPGIRAAVTAPLLHKDRGFLAAVEVMLMEEGQAQDAKAVKEMREGGLGQDGAARKVRGFLVALQQREGARVAEGLAADVGALLKYVNTRSSDERQRLLAGALYVRCVAALLEGAYTGVLQVDAGVAGGCEVDKVTAALQLNIGETKYNPSELAKALLQLRRVGKVAAYTLDKALAACFATPDITKMPVLQQLPRHLYIHGVCIYVGKPSRQQLAQWEKRGREELDGLVLGGAAGAEGLRGATLVLSAVSALEPSRKW
ncbi:hypothetical protein HXX76_003106 [Chlamydomonas incerta]|uniref:Uncharacterized protein n=1 Tax=Chlamydomonas incerta TaxID=51695 RepID=A0A835TJ97_CHLIN|nr:hypothetical protein HXX76_003106 [Chlamydomonas incerta]|eukprot:KAG2441484.1 hypothetical protein HXX76_003106 [Chlamydomonas incerta]